MNNKKSKNNRLAVVLVGSIVSGCSSGTGDVDSCADLQGVITHTVTEITGIESVAVYKRIPDSGAFESVDQFNGSEFSNLIIEIQSSWSAEQHRLSAPTTTVTSFLDWLIPPAMACTLLPHYEEYQPTVSNISIYSDSDFNSRFVAGTNLSSIFKATGLIHGNGSLIDDTVNGTVVSAREYSLGPAWIDGALVEAPATPSSHVFTITITLNDGRAYTIRTPEVLLTGD